VLRTTRYIINKYAEDLWLWWYKRTSWRYKKHAFNENKKGNKTPKTEAIDIVIGFVDKSSETIRCIKSLVNGCKNHLILADCGSKAEESSKVYDYVNNTLKDAFEISIITFNKMVGIPKTYNEALKRIKHKYSLFIHNDMEILDGSWQEKILKFMGENPRAGIVAFAGRKTLKSNGIADQKITLHNIRHIIKRGIHKPMEKAFEKVAVIDGCGFMIRNGMGLIFDECYTPHHYYDIDLSFQARNLGFDCYAANIEVEHWGDIEGSTRHLKIYKNMIANDNDLRNQNRLLFLKKWNIIAETKVE
jgi:GT2 family glycosyltransferase